MGLLKSFKDLTSMAHEAPAAIEQANQLAANARAQAASQTGTPAGAFGSHAPPRASDPAPTGPDFEPIAGVSIETYASISRSFATVGYDMTKGPELAAAQGVGPAEWQQALDGWNARVTANPAVARRFNALYTGR